MIKTMVDTLTNIFYGENWFIAWGLIALPFLIAAALSIPGLIKSMKMKKQKETKPGVLFSVGTQGTGMSMHMVKAVNKDDKSK